jgi:hypothetical protein
VLLSTRPTRVVTPGGVRLVTWTIYRLGCLQLNRALTSAELTRVASAQPYSRVAINSQLRRINDAAAARINSGRVGLALPGVRLFTCAILAVINWTVFFYCQTL